HLTTRCTFFFNHPATPQIYTLSLHDALPIYPAAKRRARNAHLCRDGRGQEHDQAAHQISSTPPAGGAAAARCLKRSFPSCRGSRDRKSTRLNSSHVAISYAVFCLKKKKIKST